MSARTYPQPGSARQLVVSMPRADTVLDATVHHRLEVAPEGIRPLQDKRPEQSEDPMSSSGTSAKVRVKDGYPPNLVTWRQQVRLALRSQPCLPGLGVNPLYVLDLEHVRWKPNEKLRVAFLGGDTSLHEDIESAAQEWSAQGNIELDFVCPRTSEYRTWTRQDLDYQAEIRISFHDDREGWRYFWSYVGRQSTDRGLACPNQASMNLQGFDEVDQKPDDWKAVVLHEFGHALGFHHEHQSPESGCDNEFRWEDDAGYQSTTDPDGYYIEDSCGRKPGVYTVMSGYPNFWTKPMVDESMRQFSDPGAYLYGAFDKGSIMMYEFEGWMFHRGKCSRCFWKRSQELSQGDKDGMKAAYPYDDDKVANLLQDRAARLKALSAVETLSDKIRDQVNKHIDTLQMPDNS